MLLPALRVPIILTTLLRQKVFLLALTQTLPQQTLIPFGILMSPTAVVLLPRSKFPLGKLRDIAANGIAFTSETVTCAIYKCCGAEK